MLRDRSRPRDFESFGMALHAMRETLYVCSGALTVSREALGSGDEALAVYSVPLLA